VHSIRSIGAMDVNKLLKKISICFCYFCVGYEFSSCENFPWTKEWEVEVLIPNNVGYVRHAMEDAFQEDEWDEYGVDDDHLASCISLRDNSIVNLEDGNEKEVDFYILLCTKTVFTFKQHFKCPWGQEFNAGDMVMAGKYYHKWGSSKSSYVLLRKSQIAYIHVCHVWAIKFPCF